MKNMISLPYFWKLAENQIKYAGKRDRTITIKIAISTARMMVEKERADTHKLNLCKIAKWINSPGGRKELDAAHAKTKRVIDALIESRKIKKDNPFITG